MTVLLILATFVLFLTIDYFYSKKRAAMPELQMARSTGPRLVSDIVAGFRIRDSFRYHPGHTWALAESPGLVRIGMDDFAARLAGKLDRIAVPKRGQWVRQGQPIITLFRDGQKAEMVSPMEGMVTDVNPAIAQDAHAVQSDPYGDGWLFAVQSPDAKTNFRNLLGGAVARKWLEESAARLRQQMPALAGATLQDGGLAVEDLTARLPDAGWGELTREFFLT